MEGRLPGRDDEAAALRGWLDEAAAGHGRTVLLGGEPGIGKSALLSSLAEAAPAAGAAVVWGRTTELDGAPPYWPWLQVLEPLQARRTLEAAPGVDPEAERFARFEAVAAVLGRSANERPLVVLLEDFHRADAASLRLLAHVASRVAGSPVLIVASHRTDAADQVSGFPALLEELGRHPSTRRLELTGLDRAAVRSLLPAADEEVVARVHAVSDGNPLLVRELARHLSAGGELDTVPRSVRDGVLARLRRRSPWCAEVVRAGAVIGRTFPAGLVAMATGRPALAVLKAVDEAVAAGLVEPAGGPGEFRFVHAVVRDAVEATLSAAELPEAHRVIAEAIEAYEGTGDGQAADLARHWEAASPLGHAERAAAWCQRAARIADRQLAWEEAARLFDRALELGRATADPLDRYERALGAARARLHCDEISAAVRCSAEAAAAAHDAGRPDLVADAVLVSETRSVAGSDIRRRAEQALEALPAEDHGRRARLHGYLANLSYYDDRADMAHHAELAAAEAAAAGDTLADIAAIRARHQLLHGPEHAEERLRLASRLAERPVSRPVRPWPSGSRCGGSTRSWSWAASSTQWRACPSSAGGSMRRARRWPGGTRLGSRRCWPRPPVVSPRGWSTRRRPVASSPPSKAPSERSRCTSATGAVWRCTPVRRPISRSAGLRSTKGRCHRSSASCRSWGRRRHTPAPATSTRRGASTTG